AEGAARTGPYGAARLLQAVRRDERGGGQRRPARGGGRAPPQSADESRDARPLAHDLARAAAPADRERDHVRRAPGASPLPLPARNRTAQRARRAPRHRAEPPRARQRRRRAAEFGNARSDRARPAPAHALALLPPLPPDGPPRARPGGPGRRRRGR